MAVNNSWRQPHTMSDWMRDIEKRLMHEERRAQNTKVSNIVGTGIGTYSRLVEDWNAEGPVVDGFFYSTIDSVINSPDDSKNWMGIVQANSIGQGLQRVWEYIDTAATPSPDPGLFTRSFITNADGTRAYTPWLQGGGGGGGGGTGTITVQDEGTEIAKTGQLDFIGAGVTAIAGTGEVQLTIDGTPKGSAGGGLTGTYPNPTLAANSVGAGQIIDGSVGSAEIADGSIQAGDLAPGVVPAPVGVQDENVTVVSPLTLLDFQGPGVTVTPGAAGEAIISIAGGGGGTGGVGQVGEIALWGTNSTPTDWLPCDGRAVGRATYPDLFNAIGTTYGVGDGSTTFNLPNMKGRVPYGRDTTQTEFDTLGETGGSKTIGVPNLPPHSHGIGDHYHNATHGHTGSVKYGLPSNTATQANASTRVNEIGSGGLTAAITVDAAALNTSYTIPTTTGTGNTGDGTPFLNPYLVVNYIIRYQTTAMKPGTVMIQDENAAVAAADIINFIGPSVSASDAGGGKVNVTVSGDGTPIGPAGGSLTGTYPNPGLAPNSVTGTHIMDSAVGTSEIAGGAVTHDKLATDAVDSGNIVNGSITAADLAPGTIPPPGVNIRDEGVDVKAASTYLDFKGGGVTATPGPAGSDITIITVPSIPSTLPPSGPAGGDLTGTYPNPSLSAATVQALRADVQDEGVNKALDIAILNFKGAGVVAAMDTPGVAGITIDGTPQGAAGGDLTGTYPNPTIKPGVITNTDELAPVRMTDQFVNVIPFGLTVPVDGVTPAAGNRVLLKHQTNLAENGIWVAAGGAWTRATDADTAAEVARGTTVRVLEGTQNRYKTFTQTEPSPAGANGQVWRVVAQTDYGASFEYPTPQSEGHLFYDWERRALNVWSQATWRQVGGVWVCTSATRPTVVYDGLLIWQTDTATAHISVGGVWYPFGSGGGGASDSGWIGAPFNAGWANYGGGYQAVQYRKIGDQCFLRGLIKRTGGNVSASSVMFTLPVGFRPTSGHVPAPAFGSATGSGEVVDNVMVAAVGDVYANVAMNTNGYHYLNLPPFFTA